MKQGQINLNSNAGKLIYDICLREDVKNIVEIGTWNGMGSTSCVYEAIKNTNKKFYSIETDPDMYLLASLNNKGRKEVNLLHGKITDELISLNDYDESFFTDYSRSVKNEWLQTDIKNLQSCENILDKIPEKIDFLILDGGEFSTFAEYSILKNRSSLVFCDDTSPPTMKNYLSRKDLVNNHEIIHDYPSDRHGFCVAKISK